MAGSHIRRLRGVAFTTALALSLFAFASRARAQNPSPPVPAAGIPAQTVSDLMDADLSTQDPNAGLMTVPQPSYFGVPGAGPDRKSVV